MQSDLALGVLAHQALSRQKPATASSIYRDCGSALAVDGELRSAGKFFHSKRDREPWISVDLGEVLECGGFVIVERAVQRERSRSLILEASHNGHEFEAIYDRLEEGETGAVTFVDRRVRARYIRVRLREENYLILRQLIVRPAGDIQPEQQEM